MSERPDKPIPWLVYVLGAALVIRTLLPIFGYLYTRDVTIFEAPDTASYVEPARQLIAHGRFSASNGTPEIIRTPGYPMLLVPGLLLGRLDLVTITLQIFISCFTVYLVYRTADLLFQSEKVALFAAAFYTVEPLSVLYTSILITETLFTAVVIISVYYLMRYLKQQCVRDLLISGIGFASSTYVRPVGYFLPMVLSIALLAWMIIYQRNKRYILFHVSAFLIVSMGLTSLWQVRNKLETGYFVFSGIYSKDLYFECAASVLAAKQHVHWREMQNRLGYQNEGIYLQQHPEQKAWTFAQRLDFMKRAAKDVLLNNRLTYARIHSEGILRSILDPGSIEYAKFFDLYPKQGGLLGVLIDQGAVRAGQAILYTHPLVFWISLVMFSQLGMNLLCSLAVLSSGRLMRDPCILTALLIVAYYLLLTGGPVALGRFRHPAMPIICVLAGYGISRKATIRAHGSEDSCVNIATSYRASNAAEMPFVWRHGKRGGGKVDATTCAS